MAVLQSKTLFFTTSPRSPFKMIPEITLLGNHFSDMPWTKQNQTAFMELLSQDDFFEGQGSFKDPSFSARDRINRAPKALGFVDLDPLIQITDAGKYFINSRRPEESLLRQLMKFQLPSPYHKEPERFHGLFYVKPYLEMLRLIDTLKKVTFDEIMIFGMQLTHYKKFPEICDKILAFRQNRSSFAGSYKQYAGEVLNQELSILYEDEIKEGRITTRQSMDSSLKRFLNTKRNNLRDYTDACFRYLRATGLVSISHRGHALSILKEKQADVTYLLTHVDRTPCHIQEEMRYKRYLAKPDIPALYTDDAEMLVNSLAASTDWSREFLFTQPIDLLKDMRDEIADTNRKKSIEKQIDALKSYSAFDEVLTTYEDIRKDALYDPPLMLEWNTWRAMNLISSGMITGNFKTDDSGAPMSTAAGSQADILCDFGTFGITVEVTMQSGQRQYEMEGEPVTRHLAKYKKQIGKDAYCLFIAPKINDAIIAHFYALHNMNISYYGGTSIIIPLPISTFTEIIHTCKKARQKINSDRLHNMFEQSKKIALNASSEIEWYQQIIKGLPTLLFDTF